jgi:hypothetical protein
MVGVAVLLPITIAGIGTRDVTVVQILQGFGVPSATAFALSLSILGIQFVGGAVGFIVEKVTEGRPDLKPEAASSN